MLLPCRIGPLVEMFEIKKSSTRKENNFKGGVSGFARWVGRELYEVSGLQMTATMKLPALPSPGRYPDTCGPTVT